MGIDARIIVKLRQPEAPTEEWLTRTSFTICSALGAKKFFISDGLPPEEYARKFEAWNAAFKAHPKFEEFFTANEEWSIAPARAKQIAAREAIVKDIGEFGLELRRRAVELSKNYADVGEEFYELPAGKTYWEDTEEPMLAAEGEWLLTVSVWSRFYGIGYERGNLPFICSVAEWFEANVPGCEVWYGGDSSSCAAERFDEKARSAIKRHFFSVEGRAYFSERNGFGSSAARPAPCGLCLPEGVQMQQYGTGNSFVAVHCAGCGKSFESRDNGKTWAEPKESA